LSFPVGRDPESVIGLDSLVKGEANILRYVARRLPGEFQYENNPRVAVKTDEILDMCERQIVWGSSESMQDAFKVMDALLKKQNTLSPSGGVAGIADYAMWSAMVNSGVADMKLASLIKWSNTVGAMRAQDRTGGGRKNSHRTRRKTHTRSRGESVAFSNDAGGSGGGGKAAGGSNGEIGKENPKQKSAAKGRNRRKSQSKSKSNSPMP
jgi:hypothetical protein